MENRICSNRLLNDNILASNEPQDIPLTEMENMHSELDYIDLGYGDLISSASSSFSFLQEQTPSPFSSRRQSATSSNWTYASDTSLVSMQQSVQSVPPLCGYSSYTQEPFIAQSQLASMSMEDRSTFDLWPSQGNITGPMNSSTGDTPIQCSPIGFTQTHGTLFEPLSDLSYYPWLENDNDGYRSVFTVVPSQTFAVPLTPRPTPVLGEAFQETMVGNATTKQERSLSPDYSCQGFDEYRSMLRYPSEDRFSDSPTSTDFGETKVAARSCRGYKKATPSKRHKIHNGIPCTVEPNSSTHQCIHIIDGKRCPNKFKRREHLKRHYDTKHGHEKPFKCLVCDREFNRADNRNQHHKTHITPSKAPRNDRVKTKEDQDRLGLTEALKPKSRRSRASKI